MPQATQNPLRAVFAGIGRILSVTDKVRNKPAPAETPADSPAPETTAPETSASDSTTSESAAPESAAPETAETEAPAIENEATDAAAAETETSVPEPAAAEAAAEPETTEAEAKVETPEAAASAPEELPLANYGDLTIASVRARLRTLSVDQLNTLIAYERANAAREDFIAMFERRLAKVESEK